MPRIRQRFARLLQRLAEPSTPQQPARVRISPRHPRSAAKATIRVAERARMRRAKQAHPREGRALQVWTAVGTILAGVAAVPALFIALNALEISEQQAALAAQQLANRVTTSSWDAQVSPADTITMQNSNTVPVVVEGKLIPRDTPKDESVWELLTFTVPACTEASFSIDKPDWFKTRGALALFVLRNTIDGRLWSVPAPGEQAHMVERTWLPPHALNPGNPRAYDVGAPKRAKKVSSCV
ncbi:hypothetical protein ACTMTF_48555 [Nonomuraea sp. ZG12]|uniref:hypothetical protein n=1 Tax=Nonomuraea sp. ZG12 TaxID=3452207 RepID=UPI003F8AB18B